MESLAGDALRRVGSLRLADEEELDDLRTDYEALREDGLEAEWLDRLESPLDRLYQGAIRHPRDGSLQPARWVRRLAARAVAAGAEIIEERRVESLDELDADRVVIATDGYTKGLVPELDDAIRPVRGQVIATEPLGRTLFDCPHYARRGFDYWQQTPDTRLVLGGQRDKSPDLEFTSEEVVTELIQDELAAFAADLLGKAPNVTHRWAGIFGMTEDDLPLVGPLPGRDGVWVAAGYSGHGNVLGLACGELVGEAVLGRRKPELDLFDPARLLG
jgi:glycine/D-amino acid oxidase-like deaminating enzyme